MFQRSITTLLILLMIAMGGCGSEENDKSTGPANLTFDVGTLPLAVLSTPYSATVQASGGKLNYQFELDHDLLPPGIIAEWVDNDLVFHGTPTEVGIYTIPVKVIDANNDTAEDVVVIEVLAESGILGVWSVVVTVTEATGVCDGEEGEYPPLDITITQAGSVVTASGWVGNSDSVLIGTISGANDEILTLSGSYPEDGGTTTATHVWTFSGPNSFSGDETWSWTDGVNTCPGGTSTVIGSR